MASVLEIAIPVVTGDELRRRHQGEAEVRFGAGTVVTPTAWDYVREVGLRVSRAAAGAAAATDAPGGAAPAPPGGGASPGGGARSVTAPPARDGGPVVREVPPPQMVCVGRCDQPDAPFGCKGDEFGSGYAAAVKAEPAAARPEAGADAAARAGSIPALGPAEVEALIQRITDLVMAELGRS